MTTGIINLEKGQRINLSKELPQLKKIRAVIGWKANATDTGEDFDVDVSVFICKYDHSGKPKILDSNWFVFYNNLTSPDGSVQHHGDNLRGDTGAGDSDGDCECITVDLDKINSIVDEMSFIVTIHDAEKRGQNFGQIRDAYVKLYEDDTGKEVISFDLSEAYSVETALQVGSLYRKNDAWNFQHVGAGYKTGLSSFVHEYGGQTA